MFQIWAFLSPSDPLAMAVDCLIAKEPIETGSNSYAERAIDVRDGAQLFGPPCPP